VAGPTPGPGHPSADGQASGAVSYRMTPRMFLPSMRSW
jgi:hypothetical protein